MNIIGIIISLLCSVALVSCGKNDAVTEKDCYVELRTSIEDNDGSRVVISQDGGGYFEDGDVMSLFVSPSGGMQSAHELTRVSGKWTPSLSWNMIGDEALFSAYYPAVNSEGMTYTHRVATNQTVEESYLNSDLLCASVNVVYATPVRLDFRHVMSRVNIRLVNDGSFSSADISSAEVSLKGRVTVDVDLATASLGAVSGDVESVVAGRLSDGTFRAVLVPQSMSDLKNGWITVSVGGRSASFSAPDNIGGKPFDELVSGGSVDVVLSLHNSEADEWADRTAWTYGITPPEAGDWNASKDRVYWKEGCGWFDCNKVNPAGDPDGSMCWAAATSNLVHWWLECNKSWVDAHGYDGPIAIPDMTSSAVFQLYKDCYPNSGNDVLRGVNWFFNGVFAMNIYDTDPVDSRAGFFRDYFGTTSLGTREGVVNKDNFNFLVKNAMNTRKGVSIAINAPGYSGHAINLWGIECDSQGVISYVYIVDNNDGPYTSWKGVMHKKKVIYKEEEGTVNVYLPDSTGETAKERITTLFTLSLGNL